MSGRLCQEQDAAVQAFALTLQHSSLGSDVRTICKIVQVCKSWRAAVQNASCAAALRLGSDKKAPSIATLAGFAQWIKEYPNSFQNISLVGPNVILMTCSMDPEQYCSAVGVIVAMGLQLAATAPGGTSHAPAALKLLTYCSNIACSTATLRALQAASSVTQLELGWPKGVAVGGTFAAALGNLTTLRQLKLDHRDGLPAGCIAGISRLQQLTYLDLSYLSPEANLQLLPQQLQHLRLVMSETGPCTISLSHLTSLHSLSLNVGTPLASGTPLPPQLHSLTAGVWDVSAVSSLSITDLLQLQRLSICDSNDTPEQLMLVGALPQLQQLELSYASTPRTLAAAPFWQQLQQLNSLDVSLSDESLGQAEHVQLLSAVAATTRLTCLNLWPQADDGIEDAEVCSHLRALTNLMELALGCDCGVKAFDALHLTTLTKLTSLSFVKGIQGFDAGVGDACAVALACELTQLQHLSLYSCGLETVAALPAIGKLTRLRHLDLRCNEGITEFGLMMLTRLTQLTFLGVSTGEDGQPSEEAVGRFWAAVRGEQQAPLVQ